MTENPFLPKSYRVPRPGTLTVTIGSERVTLDPLDDQAKFDESLKKANSLLKRIGFLPKAK